MTKDSPDSPQIPREAQAIVRALRERGGAIEPLPPTADIGDARIDLDRERRRGVPEVVYCAGKSVDQIARIMRTLHGAHGLAFGTRCSAEQAEGLFEYLPEAVYDPLSRTLLLGEQREVATSTTVGVLCAGTSDLPVAEEAARTLEVFGTPVARFVDIGVAGLHRLLEVLPTMRGCGPLIVVAGMEGALPGVVAGLVAQPVIGVPTSVGYGVSRDGMTALHTMLASCAGGLVVVNIDNGFGAAIAAMAMVGAGRTNDER